MSTSTLIDMTCLTSRRINMSYQVFCIFYASSFEFVALTVRYSCGYVYFE